MNVQTSHHVTSGPKGQKLAHLAYIDGIRGIAAAYIMLHHMYLQHREGGWEFLTYGRFAVVVFTVISGFCLTLNVIRHADEKETYWQFLRKRAAHILPGYYGGLLFSLLMITFFVGESRGTHWDHSLPVTKEGLAYSMLLVQNFTRYGSTINHTYWFIPFLAQSYLLFPLLFLVMKKMNAMTFIVTSLCAGTLILYAAGLGIVPPNAQLHFIAFFALGMGTAYAATSKAGKKLLSESSVWYTALIACAFYILTARVTPDLLGSNMYLMDMFSAATCALALATLMYATGPLRQALEWKPLTTLGVLSYAIYLVHAPLIEFVDKYFVSALAGGTWTPLQLLIVIGSLFTIIVSWGFHGFLEEPAAWYFRGRKTKSASKRLQKQRRGTHAPIAAARGNS